MLPTSLRPGTIMSTSQRVSRGFHRLGLFLAAIILLIGGSYWVFSAFDVASIYWRHHEALMCAHDVLQRDEKRFWDLSYKPYNTEEVLIDLKALECSQPVNDPLGIVRFGDVKIVPSFSWISSFGSELLFPPILITALATLILACAAYGVIRTIGWVIGGFAA
jgi:hypothetical protein